MEVGLHVVENEVKVEVVGRLNHLVESYYVGVGVELFEEDHFAVGALGVGRIAEGVEHLLDGYFLLGLAADGLPNDPVSAFAQFIQNVVFGLHMNVDLIAHINSQFINKNPS